MLDSEREAFGDAYPGHGPLFVYPDGRPLHPSTITARFNRLVDPARLPRIRPPRCPHTYATESLDAGVNPKIVSERIGHASLAFTLWVYTHRNEGRDRDAAQMIAALIVPKEPTHQNGRGPIVAAEMISVPKCAPKCLSIMTKAPKTCPVWGLRCGSGDRI